ncbi:MAG TPA: hypothetical protein H9743_02780 [Candidatus Mediterraneibacter vanvlietii]|nr:hypothetical protein [Candidatus Mediterraneibacter vanvlietii]
MVEREVYIPDTEAAIAFSTCVQRRHFEADLECDRTRIDASSLVGILAKGVGRKMKMVVYNAEPEDSEELDNALKQWY